MMFMLSRSTSTSSFADPLPTYGLPITLALLAVVGVIAGAMIAARASLRTRLLDLSAADADAQRAFGIRAAGAATELYVAVAQAVDFIEYQIEAKSREAGPNVHVAIPYSGEPFDRYDRATSAWRAVAAEAQFFAGGVYAHAFADFDAQQGRVVDAANVIRDRASLATAKSEYEKLGSFYLGQIFLFLQHDKLRSRAQIYGLTAASSIRRLSKQVGRELQAEMKATRAAIDRERTRAGVGPLPPSHQQAADHARG